MNLAPVVELARYRQTGSSENEPADGFGADIVSLDEWRAAKAASRQRHPSARGDAA